jgi:hypothetical protein
MACSYQPSARSPTSAQQFSLRTVSFLDDHSQQVQGFDDLVAPFIRKRRSPDQRILHRLGERHVYTQILVSRPWFCQSAK